MSFYFSELGSNIVNIANSNSRKGLIRALDEAHTAAVDSVVALGPAVIGSANQPLPNGRARKAASSRVSAKSRAAAIFVRMLGAPRKEILEVFEEEAGLTNNGAKTYYQNFKSGLKGWEV